MSMYNLIEYRDNYSKSESLWQYCRDEQILNDTGVPVNFLVIVLCFNLNKKEKIQQEMKVNDNGSIKIFR